MIAVDFETFYDKTYDLGIYGVDRYCEDARFMAYLVSIVGEGLNYVGDPSDPACPWHLLEGRPLCAHNARFWYASILDWFDQWLKRDGKEKEKEKEEG